MDEPPGRRLTAISSWQKNMRRICLEILLSLAAGMALAAPDGGDRRPLHLLIIDSERGEPYQTVREQVLRSRVAA